MSQPTAYLCGPITGLSTQEARMGWRAHVSRELGACGVQCLSPLRHYDHLMHVQKLSELGNPQHVLTTPQGILARDKFDVLRSDLLFVNFLGAERVSIGSIYEIAWSHLHHKPVLICMEEDVNPHDHAFVRQTAAFVCGSLDEGVEVARAVLTTGV